MGLKKAVLVVAGFGLIALTVFLLREPILFKVGDFLVVQDPIQAADVIHVIAGEDYRTDYAVHLYKQGYGKSLFFTGGWCRFHYYHHGEHAQKLSLAEGVPADDIALDDSTVTSTYAEAERLRDWILQSSAPLDSVIVVSDPHHMRRARWTYRRILGDKMELRMVPVPFELSQYKRRWWTDKESRKMVREEYTKMVYYYARYKFAWGWLRDWLASFDRD